MLYPYALGFYSGADRKKHLNINFIMFLKFYLFYVDWYFAMDVGSPGTGVIDSCEPPCGYGELNPGPLEEQSVLLTAEPSLQLLWFCVVIIIVPLAHTVAALIVSIPSRIYCWATMMTPPGF